MDIWVTIPTYLSWTIVDIWLTTYLPHLVHVVFEWPHIGIPSDFVFPSLNLNLEHQGGSLAEGKGRFAQLALICDKNIYLLNLFSIASAYMSMGNSSNCNCYILWVNCMNLPVDLHLKVKFKKCLFRPQKVYCSKPKLMFSYFYIHQLFWSSTTIYRNSNLFCPWKYKVNRLY